MPALRRFFEIGLRVSGLSVLVVLALSFAAAAAETAKAGRDVTLVLRGDETPETVKRLVDALARSGASVTVRIGDPPAASEAPAPTDEMIIEAAWASFVASVHAGNLAVPFIADLPADAARVWRADRNGATGLPAGWRILLTLLAAGVVAYGVRRALRPWCARHCEPRDPALPRRLLASGAILLRDAATLLAFAATARLARAALLPEADFAALLAERMAVVAVAGGCYWAATRFLLAPGAPQRRLLPMPRAERHAAILTVYGFAGAATIEALILSRAVASDSRGPIGLFALLGLAVTIGKLWWFWDARRDIAALVLNGAPDGVRVTLGRRILAMLTPWLFIVSATAIWMVGRVALTMPNGSAWSAAAAFTQILIVLVPIAAAGAAALARSALAWRGKEGSTPLTHAAAATAAVAAGGSFWIAGIYVLGRLWSDFVTGMMGGEFIPAARQAMAVALIAFGGWLAWTFLKTFFDGYAPPSAAASLDEEAGGADTPTSRLATVVPVIRGVALSAVVGLTALVCLSRLGVDIGPLLAGFGILGLAISFGSQALVRDIVSGFFFMLDDAFRVGEYVDTGRLRGTVEKISLRALQLRHQSGQIHTVPFGQIASLTNSSRDWALVKFNIRLDHAADLEKARKTIKKVGLALLEDEEWKAAILAPLKMQGVADILDSAIVVRLKFMAKPAYAGLVQREALKRVYAALNAAGVPFASNAVTVRGGEERAGAAAHAARLVPEAPPIAS